MELPQVLQGPLVPDRFVEVFNRWFALDDARRAWMQTSIVGFGANIGPVPAHTDQVGAHNLVVGWIIESIDHRLGAVGSYYQRPLLAGSVYCLDPQIPHFTHASAMSPIKFFWTMLPRGLPFLVDPIVAIISDDLDTRIRMGAVP